MFGRRKQGFQLCSNVLLVDLFWEDSLLLQHLNRFMYRVWQKIPHSIKMNFMMSVFMGLILNPMNITRACRITEGSGT